LFFTNFLLPEAFLERGEPLSRHHALRDTSMTVGKTVPFWPDGESGLQALMPISMKSEKCGWHYADVCRERNLPKPTGSNIVSPKTDRTGSRFFMGDATFGRAEADNE
jgi:hypothetical protein